MSTPTIGSLRRRLERLEQERENEELKREIEDLKARVEELESDAGLEDDREHRRRSTGGPR